MKHQMTDTPIVFEMTVKEMLLHYFNQQGLKIIQSEDNLLNLGTNLDLALESFLVVVYPQLKAKEAVDTKKEEPPKPDEPTKAIDVPERALKEERTTAITAVNKAADIAIGARIEPEGSYFKQVLNDQGTAFVISFYDITNKMKWSLLVGKELWQSALKQAIARNEFNDHMNNPDGKR